MNTIDQPGPPTRRPRDVIGIVASALAAVVLLPALSVFLLGLIPELNAIWWLGIVIIPILGLAGGLAAIAGVVGVVVAVRRGARPLWSIIALAMALVMLLPIAWLFVGS